MTVTAGPELEKLNKGMDFIFVLDISGSIIMLILLIGKTVFEISAGTTIFVAPEGFAPAPLAHFAGIAVVLLILSTTGIPTCD